MSPEAALVKLMNKEHTPALIDVTWHCMPGDDSECDLCRKHISRPSKAIYNDYQGDTYCLSCAEDILEMRAGL